MKHRSTGAICRFSWLMFAVCMLEVVLWAAPPVYAIASSGTSFTTGELYRNHLLKDKDHYTHANGLNHDAELEQPRVDAIARLLENESRALSSGVDSLQPDAKWNIITWAVMTAISLALGLASRQLDNSSSSKESQSTEDAESAAPKPASSRGTLGVDSVVEVSSASLLGETEKSSSNNLNPRSSLNGGYQASMATNPSREGNSNSNSGEEVDIDSSNDGSEPTGAPIPVEVVGPVLMNGRLCKVPVATTKASLVNNMQRGMKAITFSGGAVAVVTDNGVARGPMVRMPNVQRAADLKAFLDSSRGFETVQAAFNAESGAAKLRACKVALTGRNVCIRFKAFAADQVDMNSFSCGVQNVLMMLTHTFSDLDVVSGVEKTQSADLDWIEGRGKNVTADVTIKGSVIRSLLNTTASALVNVGKANSKNSLFSGSSLNAQVANILTAIYLATGQDTSQNGESANCVTVTEAVNGGEDLYISVTMPSLEVGTVNPIITETTENRSQYTGLEMVACQGSSSGVINGDHFAQLIATSVLAAELSFISEIAAESTSNQTEKAGLIRPPGIGAGSTLASTPVFGRSKL